VGLHWIYDVSVIDQLVKGGKVPEFYEPPSCPFYNYESGRNSPYGDEQLPTLQYLAASKNDFNDEKYQDELYKWSKSYDGRLNSLIKQFQENFESGKRGKELINGAENKEAHSTCKCAILVAMFGHLEDDDEFISKCKEVIAANQANTIAQDFGVAAALLIRHIAKGNSIQASLDWLSSFEKASPAVSESIQKVTEEIAAGTEPREVIKKFGPGCSLPGSFEGSIYFLKTQNNFVDAIRANILAGGDNCSRAMFIGAAFAAADTEAVPVEWKQKAKHFSEIDALL